MKLSNSISFSVVIAVTLIGAIYVCLILFIFTHLDIESNFKYLYWVICAIFGLCLGHILLKNQGPKRTIRKGEIVQILNVLKYEEGGGISAKFKYYTVYKVSSNLAFCLLEEKLKEGSYYSKINGKFTEMNIEQLMHP